MLNHIKSLFAIGKTQVSRKSLAPMQRPFIDIDKIESLEFNIDNEAGQPNFTLTRKYFSDTDKSALLTIETKKRIDIIVNGIEIDLYLDFWAVIDMETDKIDNDVRVMSFFIKDDNRLTVTDHGRYIICKMIIERLQGHKYNDVVRACRCDSCLAEGA